MTDKLPESGLCLVHVTPRDSELVKVFRHARHTMEKRARFRSFLFLKMMGRF